MGHHNLKENPMSILLIFALVCGLTAMIASLITRSWFAAVGFLGVALLGIYLLQDVLL
jgi:Na+/H+ antiporter NhaD/arsenite permease-like protein